MSKNNSNNFTIRLPEDLRKQLEEIAKDDERTLSNLIIKFLKEGVSNYEKSKSWHS